MRPPSEQALGRALWVTALLLGASACGTQTEGGPRRPVEAEEQVTVSEDDAVVATVDGTPITASRVAALVKATGRSPREVVDRLIDFELLADEARRRGLGRGRSTRFTTRQALVQRYLEQEFEATHRPEDMPESELRASYQHNITRFVTPRLHKVGHVLVWTGKRGEPPEVIDKARRVAQQIWREAKSAETVEAFFEIGKRYEGRGGFKIRTETIPSVYEGASLNKNFIKAALALEHPGDVSEPVETPFGSHVIFLVARREEKNQPFEEVRELVREKEYPFWEKRAFFDLTERLRSETRVEGYTGQKRRVLQ